MGQRYFVLNHREHDFLSAVYICIFVNSPQANDTLNKCEPVVRIVSINYRNLLEREFEIAC